MASPQHEAALCRRCQRKRRPGERFSYRGKCADCSVGSYLESLEAADERFQDPVYVEKWAQGIARAVKRIYESRKVA